jgi:hypothetical protein
MKLMHGHHDHMSIGVKKSTSYTLDVNEKVFDFFAKSLYNDKYRAIVRELSTNALDAHTVAGHSNPFDVYISDSEFKIRDYGTGLSPEQMEKLYTAYGRSDKNESNTLVGGFGLGSKSPFSYTDTFTTISYYNGQKLVYVNTKNADGIPELKNMGSTPTTEPNGLEVSFTLNSYYDKGRFQEAASKVYRYFPYQPNIHPKVNIPKLEYITTIDGIGAIKQDNYTDLQAIMGNIAYPINNSEIKIPHRLPVDLFFDIGEIDIVTSRENLRYSDKTIKCINQRFNQLVTDFQILINQDLAKAKTLYEFLKAFSKYNNTALVQAGLIKITNLIFNGHTTDHYFTQLNNLLKDTANLVYEIRPYYQTISKPYNTTTVTVGNLVESSFWEDDSPSYSKIRLKNHILSTLNTNRRGESRLAICLDPKVIDEFTKITGIEIKKLSCLPKPVITNTTSSSKQSSALVFSDTKQGKYTNGPNSQYWDIQKIDFQNTQGYYCNIDNYVAIDTKFRDMNPTTLLNVIADLPAFGIQKPTILGLKKSVRESIKKYSSWKHIDELFDTLYNKIASTKQFESYCFGAIGIPDSKYNNLMLLLKDDIDYCKEFYNISLYFNSIKTKITFNSFSLFSEIIKNSDVYKNIIDLDKKQKDIITKFENQFPILNFYPSKYHKNYWYKPNSNASDYNDKIFAQTIRSILKGEGK